MTDNFDKLFNGSSSETIEPDPRDTGNYKSPINKEDPDTFDSDIPDEYKIVSEIYKNIFAISPLGRGQILRMILCDLDDSELKFFIFFINSLVDKPNGGEFQSAKNEERLNNVINLLQHINTVNDRVLATLAIMKTPGTIIVPKEIITDVIGMLTKAHGIEAVEKALDENREEERVQDKVEV